MDAPAVVETGAGPFASGLAEGFFDLPGFGLPGLLNLLAAGCTDKKEYQQAHETQ